MKTQTLRGILAGISLVLLAHTASANEPFLPKRDTAFAKIDANKDGKLARTEFAAVSGKGMGRMDQNADGAISTAEIDAELKKRMEKRRIRLLQSLDADGNGTVTNAELDKYAEALFNGADADKDGLLSLAEAQAFKPGIWRKTYLGQRLN
jgi:hypothetical protein